MKAFPPNLQPTVGRIGVCAALTILLPMPRAVGQDPEGAGKRVVLVPPFENQTKHHERITGALTGNDPDRPRRTYATDRYAEAPRSLLENLLTNTDGVTIVERQRLDTLLAEGEFGDKSGLVDPEKAIKLGKLLGANLVAIGTLTDIRDDSKSFRGYGIETENKVTTCAMRVRLLDIQTGTVLFSKVIKGSKTYTKSTFGQTKSSDRNFAAVEAAIENLGEDGAFRAALGSKGKKAAEEPDPTGRLIEVDFSPKPDDCNVEIDGKYVGGSPLKRRLEKGKEYKVRISKGGFQEWTGTITPEAGLRVTPALARDSKP